MSRISATSSADRAVVDPISPAGFVETLLHGFEHVLVLPRDGPEEFQELGRADDGVGDARRLDQSLLGDLSAEIAIVGHH